MGTLSSSTCKLMSESPNQDVFQCDVQRLRCLSQLVIFQYQLLRCFKTGNSNVATRDHKGLMTLCDFKKLSSKQLEGSDSQVKLFLSLSQVIEATTNESELIDIWYA